MIHYVAQNVAVRSWYSERVSLLRGVAVRTLDPTCSVSALISPLRLTAHRSLAEKKKKNLAALCQQAARNISPGTREQAARGVVGH